MFDFLQTYGLEVHNVSKLSQSQTPSRYFTLKQSYYQLYVFAYMYTQLKIVNFEAILTNKLIPVSGRRMERQEKLLLWLYDLQQRRDYSPTPLNHGQTWRKECTHCVCVNFDKLWAC